MSTTEAEKPHAANSSPSTESTGPEEIPDVSPEENEGKN